jgi:poly(A) polymerase
MGGPSISAIGYLSVLSSLKLKGVYLVGGSIRDILLRSPLRDIDIAIASESIEIARIFADKIDGSFFIMDEENQVARVIKKAGKKTLQFDFASFKGRDIYEDLSNRDFTINAMATQISSRGEVTSPLLIIDPFNGKKDLKDKIIRIVKPDAFSADPLRMLRGVRLASDFNFGIEERTAGHIKDLAPSLKTVSSERIRDELFKILKNKRAHYYLLLLDEFNLLKTILPEIEDMKGLEQGSYHKYDLWVHSLKTAEYAEEVINNIRLFLPEYADKIKRHLKIEAEQGIDRLSLLKFAALLHDTGKPSTIKTEDDKISFYQHWTVGAEINKKICRRLAMSARSEEIVCRITANHMRPLYLMQLYYRNNPPSPPFTPLCPPLVRGELKGGEGGHRGVKGEKGGFITKRAMYRFFRDTRDTGIEVILLSIADAMATSPPLTPLSPPPPSVSPLTKGGDRGVGELKGGEGGFSEQNYKIVANVARKMVSYFYTEYKRQRRRSLINGADLIKRFRLQPGPVIGRILRDIDEALGAGELKNKRDAINYVGNNLHKWII